jgi:hypothetical protein
MRLAPACGDAAGWIWCAPLPPSPPAEPRRTLCGAAEAARACARRARLPGAPRHQLEGAGAAGAQRGYVAAGGRA